MTAPDAFGCPRCRHVEIPAGRYTVQHGTALQAMHDHLREAHLLAPAQIYADLTRLRPIRLEEVAR